ncbi:MAG TPA: cytochrome d ubiquinol oxidase subunit II [Ignavibacteria bacterium]|nr:cytochrome d ubiquinol oxidase subunit II [Ignavibacteria bacterium]HMR41910.1 cytochrome d ubiquinol oxidase subunit II [Ignavibacteria bacterium]
MDLNIIWFILIVFILTGYAILDGFDFGVGILHLMHKTDEERRISINSIGPLWDGNEVWLVVGGGALFAAFPEVYATVFSGFYNAFILLLLMLIFRGIAIEFRSKRESLKWRKGWDIFFSLGSFGAALLFGIAFGNLAAGVPLNAEKNITSGFMDLLNPYSIIVGLTAISLLTLHGAIFLIMKTEGDMRERVSKIIKKLIFVFITMYVISSAATFIYQPHLLTVFRHNPWLIVIPVSTLLLVLNLPREIHFKREFKAFMTSSGTIALLISLVAIGLYPNLVYSNPVPENSLNIYNSASSQGTLNIMFIIACIGAPLVLSYTIAVYWIFRGKTKLDEHSY